MGIAPGERIGRYEIVEELGRGAMGEVWKARDTKMFGELRAIKVLSDRLSTMDQARSRFTREVRTVAKLRHPNIVTIYDWGEQESRPYFVMEYLEGVNLSDIVGRSDALPFRERLQIGIQMCSALDYAHAQKVIHRDIKPGNIMIVQQGRQLLVKLVDFGIVHVEASNLTHASQPGTYSYMSPEQLRNEEIDHRSDLFSLGIVLYELFAGVHPFHAQSEPMISTKILTEGPGSLLEQQPKLPSALDGLILELLEKDPGQRPDSAEKVGESLNVIMMDWSPTEGFGTDPSTRDLDERKRRAVKGFEDDARRYEAAGSLDRALEAWKLALALAPDSRRIRGKIEALEHRLASESRLRDYLRKAGEALEAGDLQSARNHYRDAWVIRPDHPEVAEFKERIAAVEQDGSRDAVVADARLADPARDEFVRPRLEAAQEAMDGGRLDEARSGLVEILHRYPDEMLAQVLLERCIQAQTVPGLDFGAYRSLLRRAEERLEGGDPSGAREAAEQAGEVWKDDAEWKELRQRAEDAIESRGREILGRIEGLLRDADRLSDDPDQALGLVREAAAALRDAKGMGFAEDELTAPGRDIENLEAELRKRSATRKQAEASRKREISAALDRGRDRMAEGDKLAAAGPAEFTRARETYRQAREAFGRVLAEQPEHLEALDAVERLDRGLKELEEGIREHETASREIDKRLAEARELVESADALVHGEIGDLERCLRLLDDATAHVDAARGVDPNHGDARRVEEQIESLRSRARRGIKKGKDDTRKIEEGLREAREVLGQVEKLSVAQDVAALERATELCRRGERAAGRVLAVESTHREAKEALDRLEGLRQHFRSEVQRRDEDERKARARAAEVSGLLDRAERLAGDRSAEAAEDAKAVLDDAARIAAQEGVDREGRLAERIARIRRDLKEAPPSSAPPSSKRKVAGEPAPRPAEAPPQDLEAALEHARAAFQRAKKAQSKGSGAEQIRNHLTDARESLRSILTQDPSHDEANRATEKVEKWLQRLERKGGEQPGARPAPGRAAPASRKGLWIGIGTAAAAVVVVVLAVVLIGGGEDDVAPERSDVARNVAETAPSTRRTEPEPEPEPEAREESEAPAETTPERPVEGSVSTAGGEPDRQAPGRSGSASGAAGSTGTGEGRAEPSGETPAPPVRRTTPPPRETEPEPEPTPPPRRPAPREPAWKKAFDDLAPELARSRPAPDSYDTSEAAAAALAETEELLGRIEALRNAHPGDTELAGRLRDGTATLEARRERLAGTVAALRSWTGFYGTACGPGTNQPAAGLRLVAVSRTGSTSDPATSGPDGAYRLPLPPDQGWTRIVVTGPAGAEAVFPLGGVRMTSGDRREKALCGK